MLSNGVAQESNLGTDRKSVVVGSPGRRLDPPPKSMLQVQISHCTTWAAAYASNLVPNSQLFLLVNQDA